MSDIDSFANRLRKNARHWGRWARRQSISCYRIYDRDLPEYPLAVDVYEDHAHVQEFATRRRDADPVTQQQWQEQVQTVVGEVLEIPHDAVACKLRQPQKGSSQYTRTGSTGEDIVVREDGLDLIVNLHAYLDTGLFLDHRDTRRMVRSQAAGKRFLNLFSYTGSFTVYAAAGGAGSSVTVDLSNRYLDWARRNLELNGLHSRAHRLVRSDVFRYLETVPANGERFDLIVLDPPSFSNSAAMTRILDVQRDHVELINRCLRLLAPGGVLYFSTNLRRFVLNRDRLAPCRVEEITNLTVPEDFRRHRPHQCWCLSHLPGGKAAATSEHAEPRRLQVRRREL
jgi:23S rRNA (cytosine1962-C5)-methyltransferase